MTDFLATAATSPGLTLPGGIRIASDDDLRRMVELMRASPTVEKAIAEHIARTAAGPTALPIAPVPPASASPIAVASAAIAAGSPVSASVHHAGDAASPGARPAVAAKNRLRFSVAHEKYRAQHTSEFQSHSDRTADDKEALLKRLLAFVTAHHPHLGDDPWMHEIDSSHLADFMHAESQRPGRKVDEDGNALPAAARTLHKKYLDLIHFFDYVKNVCKATSENLREDLQGITTVLKKKARDEDSPYRPFTGGQISRIFSVETFLQYNRDSDYFWCPLIAAHLGVRLAEIARASVSSVGFDQLQRVWYLDVTPEEAKNSNSIRRLPITQPLIDLGFIEYVEHVRAMNAKRLFPHRNFESKTAKRQPSKRASEAFAKYLDKIGIVDRDLVFHSFRHTVVTALQDAGVPLSHSMQIVGHEAQDHAVRTGRITQQQSRSVHLSHYTHADLERIGNAYPLVTLKEALERSVKLPIDYARLAFTAAIVMEHTRRIGSSYRTGWPAQNEAYTKKQIERIAS